MDYARLRDFTADLDLQQRATARVALAVVSDPFFDEDPVRGFRQRGHGRFVKTAVDPVGTGDLAIVGPLSAAFVGMVNRVSILGRLLELGAIAMPFGGTGRLQVGVVEASETAAGAQKVIAKIVFELPDAPKKVQATVVFNMEALKSLDPQTQNGIRDVLATAVAAATDVELVKTLTAGPPATSAAPGDLLAAVSGGAPVRPVLIGGFDVLLALAPGRLRDLDAVGVTVLHTPAAANTLIALDAGGLLIADAGLELATARHASIVLDNGVAPAATTNTSLWQTNLAALRAERHLQLTVRQGACAWATA